MISVNDKDFWDRFEAGMNALAILLKEQNKFDKVFINKLFLATHDCNGVELSDQEYIKRQNIFFDKSICDSRTNIWNKYSYL